MTTAMPATKDGMKARGAFYTPAALTRFLAEWAVRSSGERVLEPSCGDGAFITALVRRLESLGSRTLGDQLLGVEREPSEAEKARLLAPHADIRTIDFFDVEPSSVPSVDAVIGNPPYIRYHGFMGGDREKALARVRAQGVVLTGLASSWAHFVVHAAAFLKPAGRLALVLPAELLHTDYGQPVREFLLRRFPSVLVIAFDRMVFENAQVDAVLLLASHDGESGLRVLRVRDEGALASLDLGSRTAQGNGHSPPRWSSSVDSDAGHVYDEAVVSTGRRLGEIASVDIGFVTGANDYFVLSEPETRQLGLPATVLTPAVRRPRDVPGLRVHPDQLSWLLDLSTHVDLDPTVRQYISEGESRGFSRRYKCRTRRPWYAVPLPRHHADAFMPYMTHFGPRLIVNEVGARSTNLLHGVSLRTGAPPVRALAVALCSSLTLLSAEIEGRAYGGGVLKLETREAERLLVPALGEAMAHRLEDQFDAIDRLVGGGGIEAAANVVDHSLGLDHERLWQAYLTFRARRLNRRRGRVSPSNSS